MYQVPDSIILASANPNKAREFEALFKEIHIEPMPDEFHMPPETGSSFYENARIKAEAARRQFLERGGEAPWVMADDSGIEVDALGGGPGIYSSRYAGEDATDTDNVDRLLKELAGSDDRGARFVCVIVCLTPEGEELSVSGMLEGRIAESPAGESGFGYDPVFMPEEKKLRVSELSAEEKNHISHRARAARGLLEMLRGGKTGLSFGGRRKSGF